MNQEKGYWQRQAEMFTSLGLFYIILMALFAVPLVGTGVVILIKGALDLRYVIIAAGCVGLVALGVVAVRACRRLRRRIRMDGAAAGETVRRNLLNGQPVEVSILNGLLKFSCGQAQPGRPPLLTHHQVAQLPRLPAQGGVTDVVDQLQSLSDLKRTGAIDADEFNLLKSMLIESSLASRTASGHHHP